MGLCHRTAKEYWDAGETLGIIRIVFEKKQKNWEFCGPADEENGARVEQTRKDDSEKKQRLSAKAKDFFERMEIREKMEAGPCRHSCDMDSNTDCRSCIKLRSLKDKGFLGNREE